MWKVRTAIQASCFSTTLVKVTDAAGAGDDSSQVSQPSEGRGNLGGLCANGQSTAAQHISQPTSAVLVELKPDRPDR